MEWVGKHAGMIVRDKQLGNNGERRVSSAWQIKDSRGAKQLPNAVKRALAILLATYGIEAAHQLVLFVQILRNAGSRWDTLLATDIVFDGIATFIIYNIYRRRNWARFALALNILFVMWVVAMARWVGNVPLLNARHIGWLSLAEWTAKLAALVLLFLPSARVWFTSDRENEISTSIKRTTPPEGEPILWKNATYISIGLFVLAMTQTAYYEVTDDSARNSAGLLLIGWMGTIASGYIEWIANPLLLYSWASALHKRYWQAVGSAVLALTLILSFLRRAEVVWTGDNGSRTVAIRGYGFGYWLWVASAAIMVTAGLALLARQLRSANRPAV
jgi:hypothetical protein